MIIIIIAGSQIPKQCILMKALCPAVLSRSGMSDSLQAHGLQAARLVCPWRFSKQQCQNGLPCPPPGDLPNPGIKLRPPTLQADSLPFESQAKTQEYWSGQPIPSLGDLPHPGIEPGSPSLQRILYQLSCQGSPHTDTTIYYLNISGYHSENLQSLKQQQRYREDNDEW